jgi:hypothetical protein
MTATESLLPEIINDFFNKIGTLLPRAKAVSCPQLAEGDIRELAERSGFDPTETLAAPYASPTTCDNVSQ